MADKVIAGYAYKGYSPSVSEKDVIEIMQSTICRADNLYLNLVDGLWYFCIKDVGGNAVEPTPEFFDMNPVSLKDYAKNRKKISVDNIEELKVLDAPIGTMVFVKGFYTAGDGAHHYRQKVDGSYTGGDAIDCVDRNKWKIVHDGEVNVSWFGIDGVNEVNYEKLKTILSYEFSIINIDISFKTAITTFDYIQFSNKVINGNNNIITLVNNRGINLQGNNFIINNLTIMKENPPSPQSQMNWSDRLLLVEGDFIHLYNCKFFNSIGPGINVSGRNIKLEKIESKNNQTGGIASNKTRYLSIIDSEFCDNLASATELSGADGFLFQRSCSWVTIINTKFNNNSEHGIYYQGQHLTIYDSEANDNHSSGFKFGSYDTDLYEYYDNELYKWVNGTGFGLYDITINSSRAFRNSSDGIYIQPSSKKVTIDKCVLRDNKRNGFWMGFFNYTGSSTRLESHIDVFITNNIAEYNSNNDINIGFNENCIINNNICGSISTYCSNNTTTPHLSSRSLGLNIKDNIFSNLNLVRSRGSIVIGNEFDKIALGSVEDIIFESNKIKNQDSDITIPYIKKLCLNEINFINNAVLVSGSLNNFPEIMNGNIFTFDNTTKSYFMNVNNITGKSIIGNKFNANSTNRGIVMKPTGCVISNNIINVSGSDYTLDISGDKNIITGNLLSGGRVYVRSGSGNIVSNNTNDTLITTLEEPEIIDSIS